MRKAAKGWDKQHQPCLYCHQKTRRPNFPLFAGFASGVDLVEWLRPNLSLCLLHWLTAKKGLPISQTHPVNNCPQKRFTYPGGTNPGLWLQGGPCALPQPLWASGAPVSACKPEGNIYTQTGNRASIELCWMTSCIKGRIVLVMPVPHKASTTNRIH